MQSVPPLALILVLSAVSPSNSEPDLPAPRNVRVYSYNMMHLVRWDPVVVKDEPMPVMYSVGFEMYKAFQELCTNITETECEFTEKILPFYRGKVRVRAQVGSRRSEWVVTLNFQPNKNTTIGPVQKFYLRSQAGKLTVSFDPPFSQIPTAWKMNYQLVYWKENSEKKDLVDLGSSTTHLLDNLEANTKYCVQVYATTHSITGLESKVLCATTATTTDVVLILVLVCVVLVVFAFVVVSLMVIPDKPVHKLISRIKIWIDGPYKIPSHVTEYLEDPPCLIPVECTTSALEEQYDHISITPSGPCQDVIEETSPDHSQPSSEKT